MKISPRFIVIDDDKFNNVLCSMVIAKVCKEADVVTFHDPVSGFEYLVDAYAKIKPGELVILLLDINMPLMNGWDFLDQFNQVLAEQNLSISDFFKIYVLSSSVDKKDIEKAHLYKNVSDYLIKPITKETIKYIIGTDSEDVK